LGRVVPDRNQVAVGIDGRGDAVLRARRVTVDLRLGRQDRRTRVRVTPEVDFGCRAKDQVVPGDDDVAVGVDAGRRGGLGAGRDRVDVELVAQPQGGAPGRRHFYAARGVALGVDAPGVGPGGAARLLAVALPGDHEVAVRVEGDRRRLLRGSGVG